MNRPHLYRRALAAWGIPAQMDMLHEEIGELLTAIGHHKRGRNTVADVAGEIADVRIMLEQLTVILDCAVLVDERMDAKLGRLEERVEAAEQAVKNPLRGGA